MSNPTFSPDDLRAIADMLEALSAALIKDGEYVATQGIGFELDYGDIPLTFSGKRFGRAVLEDGWVGFQHD